MLFIKGNNIYTPYNNTIPGATYSYACTTLDTAVVGEQHSIIMGMEILKNLQLIGELYKTKDDTTIIEELKQYSTPNYLANKVLCVTGDSEAAGHIVTDTYSKLIAQRNNMTLSNTAVNARKMAYVEDNPGAGTPLAKKYDEIREDADYILCHIGYNDEFDESEDDDSKDITKYKGAFNTIIEGWQGIRPNARIGIIIPYYFDGDDTRVKRAEWMKKRCEHYHVQYIDGTLKSGLNYNSVEQKSLYFIDIVHLTEKGHDRISYLYEQFMRGL